jgi:mono/diheme cytochrome c family protein
MRALILIALSLPVAAHAADAANGKRLANRWCAACHVVAPEQTRANADVPSFADIARRQDAQRLTRFLSNPYPRMPDMSLTHAEIADLVAYIRTLAPGGTAPPKPRTDEKPSDPRRG